MAGNAGRIWWGQTFFPTPKLIKNYRPVATSDYIITHKMAVSGKKRRRQDAEPEYERLPRQKLADSGTTSNKLPIRTQEGWIKAQAKENEQEELAENGAGDHNGEDVSVASDDEPENQQWQEINEAKEELARLAALINEDPEQNISSLRTLIQISQSKNFKVAQLALATQSAVFKDLIPGYRIRPIEEDPVDKVSKDVKKLRTYEHHLVAIYHSYVKELMKISKSKEQGQHWDALRSTCQSCACSLVLAVPHFNFRTELIKIVLNPLTRRTMGRDFERCAQTIRTMFREDDDGRPSLEAVGILTKALRAKGYQVHELTLDLFLHLRLLSEFSTKGSYDRVDRKDEETQIPKKVQRMQEKRQHRSKKMRKLLKDQKMIEKDMKEADAVVSYEERDKLQAEMLKLVFATYFRVLKDRTPHLMGSVLEGLARYAHLINQDFFGDILEALKDLIRDAEELTEEETTDGVDKDSVRDGVRESLLCNITAFALLQGQDGKAAISHLHLDLNFFISHLFRLLIPTTMDVDIELGPKSMHLEDPSIQHTSRKTKVNVKTKTVLLIRCLSSTLIPPTSIRSVPPVRLAAFTKQLMTVALQLPEKSAQAMLGLLAQTSKVHGRAIAALWNTEERRGDGVYDYSKPTIEGTNPFASTVFEGELLRLHFSPKVREALDIVVKNIREAS